MVDTPAIIVGLGNPGNEHAKDRHNVGYWFVDDLVGGSGFRSDQKVLGESCQLTINSTSVRLVKPTTYMNRSGQSVRRAMDYYKVEPENVLIVYDDLDLPPGTARFKRGGGHGGHNGLRDLIAHCGREFLRLRIGIGHPGRKEQVSGYVLRPPLKDELPRINDALMEARRGLDILFSEGLEAAMHYLHTATARENMTQDLGPAG